MPTLYLIDASALAYRSHFALSRTALTSAAGEPTGAIFGAAVFLNSLLNREDLTHIAAIFDSRGPTFRHELYHDYKATRQKMPDELSGQLEGMKEMIRAMGLETLEMPGFEADDIIGTLAVKAAALQWDVFIVSGDKDFGQIVGPKVKLMVPHSGGQMEIIDEKGVLGKWGVPPDKIVDYMGLKGDTSDHVPGVPKVGDKTAAELINTFGSLDEVLAQAPNITKPALRQNLIDFADQARLSRQLVTLHTEVPLSLGLDHLARRPADIPRLMEIYRRYSFHNLLEKLEVAHREEVVGYHAVTTPEDLEALIPQLKRGKPLSVDLETTAIDPMQAQVVGFSFSIKEGEAYYVPAEGGFFPASDTVITRLGEPVPPETCWVLQKLRPLWEDATLPKTGQNLKYDGLVLRCYGIELKGVKFDSMVAAYVLDPTRRVYNMDSLALEYLNFKKIPTSSLIGLGRNQISMREVSLDKISQYACEDADVALRLERFLGKRIKEGSLNDLFHQLEIPLILVLMEMEFNGMALDVELLKSLSQDMSWRLNDLTVEIYRLAGTEFNINSTQQLAHILFEKLQLKPIKKTKTGYSTDVEVLEKLAIDDPLPRALLEYRQIQKLKSTYVDALPNMINPVTGRVHTSFNQTVASTGRLSSSDPNLQNIPIRTETGGQIRRAFVPGNKKSQVLLSADYSQIELRLVAHIANDEGLMEAFRTGHDVHTSTAAKILHVSEAEVTPEMRRSAKEINFGIMYGMGDYGLSERLGIPVNVAAEFRKEYFKTYPGVRAYMDNTIAAARKTKRVTTLLGRHRLLPDMDSKNRNVREFAERTAINTPIQGSAADMIKLAMIRIHDRLKKMATPMFPQPARMLLQVHDELVFEVEKSALEEVKQAVKEEMEGAMKLNVPVVVELGVGENWLEAH
jgi:DNA polymerase-1